MAHEHNALGKVTMKFDDVLKLKTLHSLSAKLLK